MADEDKWKTATAGAATGATVGAPLGPVGMAGGALIGGAAGYLAEGAGDVWDTLSGTGFNADSRFGEANQSRGQQQQAGQVVGNWAMTGQGPSAAQAMLERNRAGNTAAAVGAAKSAGAGSNPHLASRYAADAAARGVADASYQAQELRMREQQQAMQQYLAMLDAARQADISTGEIKLASDMEKSKREADTIGGFLGGAGSAMGGMA